MYNVTRGKSSIFIAHRLSTIVDADDILVLGEGRVMERGTHGQLISNPGSFYAELWAKQNRMTHTVNHPHHTNNDMHHLGEVSNRETE